jgi:hypothetical protein
MGLEVRLEMVALEALEDKQGRMVALLDKKVAVLEYMVAEELLDNFKDRI